MLKEGYAMHMPSPNTVAPAQGLYQPDEFKDNCGFGLIAHMQGDASHHLVKTAIHSLSCMTHRGGIAADGKTGDGCGLLLAMPKAFFREEAKKLSDITLSEIFAVGTVFLNLDPALAQHSKNVLTKELDDEGLRVIAWRVVPTNNDVLGEIALESLPAFEQVIVNCPMGVSEVEFNRKLFMARRRAEEALVNDASFYVTTLSSNDITYKGLMMPAAIADF